MSWFSRLANVFRPAAVDRDLDDEVRFHLEARIEDLVRGGLTAEDARAEAVRRFGSVSRVHEESREVKRQAWLPSLGQDLRYGCRLLRKSPGFTAAALLSLGLGIGTNTAIFTVLDQVLLRPLPVERPRDLALVRIDGTFNGTTAGDGNEISYPMFVDFRDHNDVFSGMFARFGRTVRMAVGDRTERINGELVSGSYFAVLGVRAIRGRVIGEDDDQVPGAEPRQVTWLFLRDALLLVGVGCAIALPLVWAAGSYTRSQLYGVEPIDPTTIAFAAVLLCGMATAGSAIPALRGARLTPLAALKDD